MKSRDEYVRVLAPVSIERSLGTGKMGAGKSGISSKIVLTPVQLANVYIVVSFLPELAQKDLLRASEADGNFSTGPPIVRTAGLPMERASPLAAQAALMNAVPRSRSVSVQRAFCELVEVCGQTRRLSLKTWKEYQGTTRAAVGKVNVHGYYQGTEPYRGPNRNAFRTALSGRPLWQSEYDESDASGYTMAHRSCSISEDFARVRGRTGSQLSLIRKFTDGFAQYRQLDTHGQVKPDTKSSLVRVNRKFWVFGQFTRYIRPGYRIIGIGDSNSVTAYDIKSHKLVFVTATGDDAVAEWKQHVDVFGFVSTEPKALIISLYAKSAYTFSSRRFHRSLHETYTCLYPQKLRQGPFSLV